ncbi:hypothetical protein BCR35DRAFT_310518 [Leucosporidium creatinivorum]|uniref:EF-hand domain-containing protein n=1 Tax=Leucosporidium creatinivorum TaxID=106004 RepID=A0A1Y2D2N4_9BASI|nr:hypothetical protein BCR35DRAFT_310518 [Leucosporidium creatinivorum]
MSSLGIGRPSRGTGSTRHPRQSSGAFGAVFEPSQVQTFKEAFNYIDTDNDGWITEKDLYNILGSLGQPANPERIKALLSTKPTSGDPTLLQAEDGRINFTMFVTMMAEQLSLLDSEPELLEAFASFDPKGRGVINPEELRKCLKNEGEVMSDEEIDRLLHGPFIDSQGNFKYREFCETLRVTEQQA